mgnify:CR=1 FL=1
MTIEDIIARLSQAYGPPRRRPHRDPLSELILTILSQNTSDVNSGRAFERLTALGSWERVSQAPVEKIAEAIRPGGLAQVKAPRLLAILRDIQEQRGSLGLSFLDRLSLDEARTWLRRLPGVGPKTAACVLLFSLGKPALPVDTHLHRVAQRLGLIGARVTPEKAHQLLEAMVLPDRIYPFHLLMIEHGRRTCLARRPRCPQCVLLEGCPTGKALLGDQASKGAGQR